MSDSHYRSGIGHLLDVVDDEWAADKLSDDGPSAASRLSPSLLAPSVLSTPTETVQSGCT